jgi:integrase
MAKPRRAARGDGSIYQRKSDGRWVGAYHDEMGKRRYVYADKASNRESDVRRKLRVAQANAAKWRPVEASQHTVASYLAYWYQVALPQYKPRTQAIYPRNMRLHILPKLGHVKLTQLRMDMIQKRVTELAQVYAPRTVRGILTGLSSALRDAVEWGFLPSNPCRGVKLPRREKREERALEIEEVRALLLAAKESPIPCLMTVAFATGMRKGELFALRWTDINLAAGTLRVSRTVGYLNLHGKCEFIENPPKSASGNRTLRLPLFAIEALKEHRVQQNELRLRRGAAWQQKDLVFCNQNGGYYYDKTINTQFKKLLAAAGIAHMRFHDIRHTVATILIAQKVSPKLVQELMGHSDLAITLGIYARVLASMQHETMETLNALFGR